MNNPLKSLLSSDHGLLAVLLVIGATVLAALGKTDWGQWMTFSQWIFGIFAGAHAVVTVGGSVGSAISGSSSTQAPTPTPITSVVKQTGSIVLVVLMFLGAVAVGALSACSAADKAKETAVENGFVDCAKAQGAFGDIISVINILKSADAEKQLEALALTKGEAVVACTVKDAVAILFPSGADGKPTGAQPTPEAQRANAYLALKGYKFR